MTTKDRIPVTILTGFLGAGKTALLNRILKEKHGKRIAVIKNEYGEVGMGQALVADEEMLEMSNGCTCWNMRGDLIRILGNLLKRRDKFDYVVVETAGAADPGLVAETFFMDDLLCEEFRLDGIVALVDARQAAQQLGRNADCDRQVAFADVVLLNEVDLVEPTQVDELEVQVRGMNKLARVHRCKRADVPVAHLLNLRALDLDAAGVGRPTFSQSEYPFEWAGVYELGAGVYQLDIGEGPYSEMSLVIVPDAPSHDAGLKATAAWCTRKFADEPLPLTPGAELPLGVHVVVSLAGRGRKLFPVRVSSDCRIALYTQHLAEAFSLQVQRLGGEKVSFQTMKEAPRRLQPAARREAVPYVMAGAILSPVVERVWAVGAVRPSAASSSRRLDLTSAHSPVSTEVED